MLSIEFNLLHHNFVKYLIIKKNYEEKKIILLMLCASAINAFSQNIFNKRESAIDNKVNSGVIYSQHPALDAINSLNNAFVSGDLETYASYFEKDFKFYGLGAKDLEEALEVVAWWNDNFILKWETKPPAFADIIQYTGNNDLGMYGNKDGVWVFDWILFTAINKIS